MKIKIELDDEQLRAKLRELIRLGNDLSPITVAISEELKAITESAFQKEQDPTTGKAWDKLSDVTLAAIHSCKERSFSRRYSNEVRGFFAIKV